MIEGFDVVFQGDVLAGGTGEYLGHKEGLGQETLNLTGPVYDHDDRLQTVHPSPEWR
jgi:hypothetical protein